MTWLVHAFFKLSHLKKTSQKAFSSLAIDAMHIQSAAPKMLIKLILYPGALSYDHFPYIGNL